MTARARSLIRRPIFFLSLAFRYMEVPSVLNRTSSQSVAIDQFIAWNRAFSVTTQHMETVLTPRIWEKPSLGGYSFVKACKVWRCTKMSQSVAVFEDDEERIAQRPQVVEAFYVPVCVEPDWDEEAGLTGALEGNERNLKRLKPIQYKAISLSLQGKTQSHIASKLGVSRKSISRWFEQGSLIREIFEKRQHDLWVASVQFESNLLMKAMQVANDALESPDERNRLRAASMVLRYARRDEPFDPDNIPAEECEHREDTRSRVGQYYSYSRWAHPSEGEIDREIQGDRSEHDHKLDYNDIGESITTSFTLQPFELDGFCEDLAVRDLEYRRDSDAIHVFRAYQHEIASIYSIRAEQPSILYANSLTNLDKYNVNKYLDISFFSEVSEMDMGNTDWVIIPKSVSRYALLKVLTHLVKEPHKLLERQMSLEDSNPEMLGNVVGS
jgi:hypothetical protein